MGKFVQNETKSYLLISYFKKKSKSKFYHSSVFESAIKIIVSFSKMPVSFLWVGKAQKDEAS